MDYFHRQLPPNAGIKLPPRAAVGLNDLLGGNVSELRGCTDEAALNEVNSAESALQNLSEATLMERAW